MRCRYLVNQDSVVVTAEGQRKIWVRSEPDGVKAFELIQENTVESDQKLYDMVMGRAKAVKKYADWGFESVEDVVFINGEALPDSLGRRLVDYAENNIPCTSLLNFWDRLKQNPSEESKKDLFGFIDVNQVTLTNDGFIIFYKRIDENYKDLYTHSIDNSVGSFVEIERHQVDPDRNITCSYGLHVCSFSYLQNGPGVYSDKHYPIVEVKVDPADVVAVPTDYNNAKCRVRAYLVLQVSPGEPRTDLVCSPSGEVINYAPSNQEEWDESDDSIYDEDEDDCCDCGEAYGCDCDDYDDEDVDLEYDDDDYCPDCDELYDDCDCDYDCYDEEDDDTCSDPECSCYDEVDEVENDPTPPKEDNGFLGWKKWFGR